MKRCSYGIRVLLPLALYSASVPALADDAPPGAPSSSGAPSFPSPIVLPIVSFRADGAGGDLFDALQTAKILTHLSKDAPGSPIQLRVYQSVHPAKMDAKNFFSGLAFVGTLGLAPVVMSGDYTMHYEIYVNGESISRYEYTTKLSRTENGRGKADPTHGLGADGVVWARSTVDLFLKDLEDESVRALGNEYQTYFGAPAPTGDAGSSPER
jgi:hypothetical protein